MAPEGFDALQQSCTIMYSLERQSDIAGRKTDRSILRTAQASKHDRRMSYKQDFVERLYDAKRGAEGGGGYDLFFPPRSSSNDMVGINHRN